MANTTSAKKAIRTQARKRAKNLRHLLAFRQARKSSDETKFYKEVDKAAKVGAVSRNAASRYKSSFSRKLNKIAAD